MGYEWLAGLVSRVCLYMDCTNGMSWEVWGWVMVWEGLRC